MKHLLSYEHKDDAQNVVNQIGEEATLNDASDGTFEVIFFTDTPIGSALSGRLIRLYQPDDMQINQPDEEPPTAEAFGIARV